jgi:hypothetical protein
MSSFSRPESANTSEGSRNIGVNVPLMTCLAPLDNASQLLRCSLHANSHYETVMFHSESWRAMSNEEAGMHYPTGPNKSSEEHSPETSLRDPSEVLALSGLEKELMSLQNGVQKLNLDIVRVGVQ